MTSRFASFLVLLTWASLTAPAFGQTVYSPNTYPGYPPQPVTSPLGAPVTPLPQPYPAGAWPANPALGMAATATQQPPMSGPSAPAAAAYRAPNQTPPAFVAPTYAPQHTAPPYAPQHAAPPYAPQHTAPPYAAPQHAGSVNQAPAYGMLVYGVPYNLPVYGNPVSPNDGSAPAFGATPLVPRAAAFTSAPASQYQYAVQQPAGPHGTLQSHGGPGSPAPLEGHSIDPGVPVPADAVYQDEFPGAGVYFDEAWDGGQYGYGGSVLAGSALTGSALAGSGWGSGFANARYGVGGFGCTSPWFVGFGGLWMTRDDENHYHFSYDSADESIQLTNARDANFSWAGGFETSFGRMFNGGRHAIEAVYWGLFPSDGSIATTNGATIGSLNGILNWDQLNYGTDPLGLPWTADEFVNNSTIHMVRRQNEIHNVEVNLLSLFGGGRCSGGAYGCAGGPQCGGGSAGGCGTVDCGGCAACGGAGGYVGRTTSLAGIGHHGGGHHAGGHHAGGGGLVGAGAVGSPWSHQWLVGLRLFRFRDHLLFGAERAGGNGVFLDEDDEIYYNVDVVNQLVGVQLGCSGAYACGLSASLDYGIKFGLFGNQIDHTSEIGGSHGVATINNGPNAGVDFFVQNTKSDVAFLGEANLGASWRFGSCWRARIGYRAVAVTGVALPTNQIYHDLRGIQDVRWVDSNGSLILHGGYCSAEYRF